MLLVVLLMLMSVKAMAVHTLDSIVIKLHYNIFFYYVLI